MRWIRHQINCHNLVVLADGVSEHEAPSDVGGGHFIASVKDPDGNIIGLAQAE